jgi:hypothetical protein
MNYLLYAMASAITCEQHRQWLEQPRPEPQRDANTAGLNQSAQYGQLGSPAPTTQADGGVEQ